MKIDVTGQENILGQENRPDTEWNERHTREEPW